MCATIGTVHEISFEVSDILRYGFLHKRPGVHLEGQISCGQVTRRQ
jgi:hypothetical protein